MIKVIGGKIVLNTIRGNLVAIDINGLNVLQEGDTVSCVSNGLLRNVQESFDDILEAIEKYKNDQAINAYVKLENY